MAAGLNDVALAVDVSAPVDGPALALNAEELKKRSVAAKALAASLGEAVAILARSPDFKNVKLGDLPGMVGPALARGQFAIANAQQKNSGSVSPVAFVSWAIVSNDLDQKFGIPGEPAPRPMGEEWSCGENVWIVDAIGASRAVGALLKSVASKQLKGRIIKYKSRDGKPEVLQI